MITERVKEVDDSSIKLENISCIESDEDKIGSWQKHYLKVKPYYPAKPNEEMKELDELDVLEDYVLDMLNKADNVVDYIATHELVYKGKSAELRKE